MNVRVRIRVVVSCIPVKALARHMKRFRKLVLLADKQLAPCGSIVIALLQAATATVLSFALNKSKAENTAGGIVYETTLKRDC